MTIPRDFYTKQNQNLKISGIEDYRNFFIQMKEELVDLSDMGDIIAQTVIEGIQNRTAAGVDPKGVPFIPYKSKANQGRGKVDLKQTGTLLNSIQQRQENIDALITVILFYTGIEAIIAWVHHTGAISGRKVARFQMPERPFFDFSNEDIGLCSKLVEKKITDFILAYKPK